MFGKFSKEPSSSHNIIFSAKRCYKLFPYIIRFAVNIDWICFVKFCIWRSFCAVKYIIGAQKDHCSITILRGNCNILGSKSVHTISFFGVQFTTVNIGISCTMNDEFRRVVTDMLLYLCVVNNIQVAMRPANNLMFASEHILQFGS